MEINATFTFSVMQEENEGELHIDQLKPFKNRFLEDVKDHLQAELQEHEPDGEVHFETNEISDNQIRMSLTFTRQLEEPEVAYIKERLTRWTKVIGDKLYQYSTESGHYISKVKVEFHTNGGKRKRKSRRTRKYKCQTHINIPILK